jgi:Holliday junction resolvase YEN1
VTSGISVLPPNSVSSIKFVKQKVEQTDDESPVCVLKRKRKLTFSPFSLTSLRKEDFEGERLGYWNGNKNYWLQKSLPQDVLEPPPPAPKSRSAKRKQNAEASDGRAMYATADFHLESATAY